MGGSPTGLRDGLSRRRFGVAITKARAARRRRRLFPLTATLGSPIGWRAGLSRRRFGAAIMPARAARRRRLRHTTATQGSRTGRLGGRYPKKLGVAIMQARAARRRRRGVPPPHPTTAAQGSRTGRLGGRYPKKRGAASTVVRGARRRPARLLAEALGFLDGVGDDVSKSWHWRARHLLVPAGPGSKARLAHQPSSGSCFACPAVTHRLPQRLQQVRRREALVGVSFLQLGASTAGVCLS